MPNRERDKGDESPPAPVVHPEPVRQPPEFEKKKSDMDPEDVNHG